MQNTSILVSPSVNATVIAKFLADFIMAYKSAIGIGSFKQNAGGIVL